MGSGGQILKDDAVTVLHSICQQTWKTQQWPQDWKRSVFIPIPKKGNAKECSNYHPRPKASRGSPLTSTLASASILASFRGQPGSLSWDSLFQGLWTRDTQAAGTITQAPMVLKPQGLYLPPRDALEQGINHTGLLTGTQDS